MPKMHKCLTLRIFPRFKWMLVFWTFSMGNNILLPKCLFQLKLFLDHFIFFHTRGGVEKQESFSQSFKRFGWSEPTLYIYVVYTYVCMQQMQIFYILSLLLLVGWEDWHHSHSRIMASRYHHAYHLIPLSYDTAQRRDQSRQQGTTTETDKEVYR